MRVLPAICVLSGLLCVGMWVSSEMLGVLAGPMFPDRKEPGLHRDVVEWQGGKIGFADHSGYPGTCNWKLEWHGPQGERRILSEMGDTSPSFRILADGTLVARHVRDPEKRLVVEVFRSPFVPTPAGAAKPDPGN